MVNYCAKIPRFFRWNGYIFGIVESTAEKCYTYIIIGSEGEYERENQ